VITPLPRFRPNPKRSIYVQGIIDQAMIDKLTPEIISLLDQNRDPITVYIDSDGGNVIHMETILRLLNASDLDGAPPCWNVTVVTGRAASAAADLLASGDYAVAYPGSRILYHGVRVAQDVPLTTERTSLLVRYLRESNNIYATELARKVVDRFMFRFVSSKLDFDGIRKNKGNAEMTDLDCFLVLLQNELSESAKRVLMSAQMRFSRYDELLESLMKRKMKEGLTKSQVEAVQIKAIVDFEVRKNRPKKNWSFEGGGLDNLADDFFLLNEYLGNYRTGFFDKMCLDYGHFLIDQEDNEAIKNAPEDERDGLKIQKSQPFVLPVWSFFVALCHALQYGENNLSARDAVWFGLIDEVIGVDMPSRRLANEYNPYEEDKENVQADGAVADAAAGA
jgi:ATP-dependent protease ClpP protease subunit